MVLREKHYIRRPDKYFHKVYNAGQADFGKKEQIKDEFGTPIGRDEFESKVRLWYRRLGITAEDLFYARSEGKEVQKKVAVKGYIDATPDMEVKIKDQLYAIDRIYYDPKDDETEFTLYEVN